MSGIQYLPVDADIQQDMMDSGLHDPDTAGYASDKSALTEMDDTDDEAPTPGPSKPSTPHTPNSHQASDARSQA